MDDSARMSVGQKVQGCSCQLCNPSFVDEPVPPIKQDENDDTEWSIMTGKSSVVQFQGKIVAAQAPTLVNSNQN